jgi:TM2 domain
MPFCTHCGAEANSLAVVCVKCGVALPGQSQAAPANPQDKEWVVTLLLCFFLGIFGVHRFYTGHTMIGVVQLLTLGGCGIWALIDFILILVGNYKDASGRPLRK